MLGTAEIVGIGIAVVVLFGAKRLPELGRSLGQGIKEFRKSAKSIVDDDEERSSEPKSDS